MKHLTMLLLFILAAAFANGQTKPPVPDNIRATNTLDGLDGGLNPSEILYGIPVPQGKVIGDTYLFTEWMPGTLVLYPEKTIKGYLCRYDIENHQIEFQTTTGEVRAIPGKKARSFSLTTANKELHFTNGMAFRSDGIEIEGFFQVLFDAPVPLLKLTTVHISQPTYKPELAMGSRDYRISKKNKYFTRTTDGRLVELKTKSKRKFVEPLEMHAEDVAKFINDRSLKASDESDLIEIFTYVNDVSSSKILE